MEDKSRYTSGRLLASVAEPLLCGNRHRLAGFAHFVETADFRIFAVGGHLPVDLFQKKVQLGFDFFRGREAFEAV